MELHPIFQDYEDFNKASFVVDISQISPNNKE